MTLYEFTWGDRTEKIKALNFQHACTLFEERFGFWPTESTVKTDKAV